ncbi:hyaluronan-mediated motility receptor-like [Halichondria panicea]|uniref:hyaluronan-mediated motility receptor-like n=1 Tax=Halichondria panicea TaxID=6063 RepID=UPI00312BBC1F
MFSRANRFNSKGPETPAPGAYDVKVGGRSSGALSFDKSSRFKKNSSNDLSTDSADSSLLSISQTPYKTPRGRPPTSGYKTQPHSAEEDSDSADNIRQLEEQLRRLSCTCSDLTEQLLASGNLTSTLQARMDSELKEKYSLQEELSFLKKKTDSGAKLEATVTRLRDKMSTLKEDNSHLTQQLDTARATCQDQEDQLFSLREETTAQRSERDCLREQLDQERVKLVTALETQEQLASDMDSTHTQLLDKIRVLEERVLSVSSERDRLQECLGTTREELVVSKEMVAQQQTEHQLALEDLTRKCLALEEEAALQCQTHKDSECVLRAQLLSTQEAHTRLDEENQATLRALSTKETQLEEVSGELASLTTAYSKDKLSNEEQLRVAMETIQQVQRTTTSMEAVHRSSMEEATRRTLDLEEELAATQSQLTTILSASSDLKQNDEETDAGVRVDHQSLSDSNVRRLDNDDQAARIDDQAARIDDQTARIDDQTARIDDQAARIAELEAEVERLTQENDGLKQAYAELEEKYAPYQETIDKLEAQNKLLTSQTAAAQQEAQRLSEQYAKLLGHQNTRQKIMHVKNLKDENAALKQEVIKLKNELTHVKRTMIRREDETSAGVKGKPLLPRN